MHNKINQSVMRMRTKGFLLYYVPVYNANNIKWITLSCIIGHVHRIVTVLVVEMKA